MKVMLKIMFKTFIMKCVSYVKHLTLITFLFYMGLYPQFINLNRQFPFKCFQTLKLFTGILHGLTWPELPCLLSDFEHFLP